MVLYIKTRIAVLVEKLKHITTDTGPIKYIHVAFSPEPVTSGPHCVHHIVHKVLVNARNAHIA